MKTFLIFCFAITSYLNISCDSTPTHGYNELSQQFDSGRTYTVSDYNSDNEEIEEIKRPKKSVLNTSIDTSLLFDVWVSDTTSPSADFIFSKDYFDVQDYDGNGAMPYVLKENDIKVYYNDFIQDGKIISVNKDTLTIKWVDSPKETYYVRWRF